MPLFGKRWWLINAASVKHTDAYDKTCNGNFTISKRNVDAYGH